MLPTHNPTIPLALIAALLLAACATRQPTENEPSDPAEAGATEPEFRRLPDSAQLIYVVNAADLARQRGEHAEALRLYTRAAELSNDYRVAARAFAYARRLHEMRVAKHNLERWKTLRGSDFDGHVDAAIFYAEIGDLAAARSHLEVLRKRLTDQEKQVWQNIVPIVAAAYQRDADTGRRLFDFLVEEWGYAKSQAGLQAQSQLALSLGDAEHARRIADRAVDRGDDEAAALAWRGRLLAAQGDLEAASQDFRRSLALDPEAHAVRVQYARLLFNQDDYQAAIEQLEQVPDEPLTVFSKAYYALEAGEPERAEAFYQDLTQLEAEDADEWAYLTGQLADELDLAQEAFDWYDRVAGGDRLTPSRLRMAMILSERGDMDAARAVLRNLQNGNAETASQAFQVEGAMLSEAGRDDEALSVYSRALDQMPDDDELRYARALHAERLDQVAVAESDLRNILERNPEDPNALNALGYTLADRTDRYDEALELIERAYALAPDEAAIVDSMGWVQFRLGNYAEAEKYLRRALSLQFDAEIAAHLGEVLWAMGREQEAREIWSEGLDRSPDSRAIQETRDRLTH